MPKNLLIEVLQYLKKHPCSTKPEIHEGICVSYPYILMLLQEADKKGLLVLSRKKRLTAYSISGRASKLLDHANKCKDILDYGA